MRGGRYEEVAFEYQLAGATGDSSDGGCDVVPVTDGQVLELECDDDCEAEYEGGMLEIEASTATLIVTAVDESGNVSVCTEVICQPTEDDSPIPPHMPAPQAAWATRAVLRVAVLQALLATTYHRFRSPALR